MTHCPECSRPVWLYDEFTLTCKAGHHTRIGEPEPVVAPEPQRRRWSPSRALSGALGGALVVLVSHALSHLL